jgi:hypothetical protein
MNREVLGVAAQVSRKSLSGNKQKLVVSMPALFNIRFQCDYPSPAYVVLRD